MSIHVKSKSNGVSTTLFSTRDPITEISPTASNGRARVSIRISSEGRNIGFERTLLESSWVTVEMSEELPHRNSKSAQQQAFSECRKICQEELVRTMDFLLASMTLSDEDRDLFNDILDNTTSYAKAGVKEKWLVDFSRDPLKTFRGLEDKDKQSLRGCR